MSRSSAFGSTPSYCGSPCSDSVSLRLPYPVKLAAKCKSLTHYTKGTRSPCFKRSAFEAGQASGNREQGTVLSTRRYAAYRLLLPVTCYLLPALLQATRLKQGSHCLYACGFRIYF